MKLNHANLIASDVKTMARLFERFFGFRSECSGDDFEMLRGTDDFSLVIMAMDRDGSTAYPSATAFGMSINVHLGFVVSQPSAVYDKHSELQKGGCHPGPIKTFDAVGKRWTAFYCPVGDGIDVEVTATEEIRG